MKALPTMKLIPALATLALGLLPVTSTAAPPKGKPVVPLNADGERLLKQYQAAFESLRGEIVKELPAVDPSLKSAAQDAVAAVKAAEAKASTTKQALGKIQSAKALVDHAKGKWIGEADKGIAKAEAALKKATNDPEREAAMKELAKWQANRQEGVKALKERQEALDKAKLDEPKLAQANQSAQAELAQARAKESAAVKALLVKVDPVLASDKLDAKLVPCALLAEATPRGLAEFAQLGKEQEALVGKLLSDPGLMVQMLEAGGARFNKYGRTMELYAAIQKASPKAREGVLQRLALAVSLEHAVPVAQSNPQDETNAPATVDPVKRYLHYEKAYLEGELDPAFKTFTVWELRMVVDCDAPDRILVWGREMLRNYRPDHIFNPDYGWRYAATVKTEVPYGSQNVKYDLPSLQNYQNIIKDGGICGRRAFFGRFILQSFGIPTWGVTQHKHAAVGHWTPKGWVVNLGAGFEHSWWDKDEAPRSGSDFLRETQAREHGKDFFKVLRSHWISSILGEQAFNDRKGIPGGFWSGIAHNQTVALASTAVPLGPLGQELSEANEPKEKQKIELPKLTDSDKKYTLGANGAITIPAVAFTKPSGHFSAMRSFAGGMQVHASGGFKADYAFELPKGGKYLLTAKVVTAQEGQKFQISANDIKQSVEIAVPYTIGLWEQTKPVEVALVNGKNVVHMALVDGSRGVTIKEFTLTPVK